VLSWRALAATLLLTCVPDARSAGSLRIPFFFSDNHAGTFEWIAQTFPLDKPHVLVLVDAHSDATAVDHSDAVRRGLRDVGGVAARDARVREWRQAGRVQAFNWIEPLMPLPVSQVLWVARAEQAVAGKGKLRMEAVEALDARLEFEARAAGSLAALWKVEDLAGFEEWDAGETPVIVSIDLDFFCGMREAEAMSVFGRLWTAIMRLPRLAGVSFAVSRPWLEDAEEAERLLVLAMDAVLTVENRTVSIGSDEPDLPDDSLKAADLRRQRAGVPRFDWNNAGPAISSRLTALRAAGGKPASLESIRLVVDRAAVGIDGTWRVDAGRPVVVRLAGDGAPSGGRTRWYFLEPGNEAVDLLPEAGFGKNFAPRGTARAVWNRRIFLGESGDGAFLLPLPDGEAALGRWRVQAEVLTDSGRKWSDVLEVRVQTGEGFRRSLAGQFRSPYVFGIGLARGQILTGPDLGWGYDCANFLIAGWRDQGVWMPWGDPGKLRKNLETVGENLGPADRPAIREQDVTRGLVMDFGPHVAAVWEDRAPKGTLGAEDVAVHHLGGLPELISVGELTRERPRFALRRLPETRAARVWFGGDVVLDKRAPELEVFETAAGDPIVINLEGVGAEIAEALPGRYRFVFPARHLSALRAAGVTAISVANNHSLDGGLDGLRESLESAGRAGLKVAGIPGQTAVLRAAEPKIALVAASLFPEQTGAIVSLPRDADLLEKQIRSAQEDAAAVVAMLHGGDEYSSEVNDAQREWARWCIDRGAALVVFAHPHVVQPLESYRGRPVAFSLGNLVYPPELRGADSGAWLRVDFSEQGNVMAADLVPLGGENR